MNGWMDESNSRSKAISLNPSTLPGRSCAPYLLLLQHAHQLQGLLDVGDLGLEVQLRPLAGALHELVLAVRMAFFFWNGVDDERDVVGYKDQERPPTATYE